MFLCFLFENTLIAFYSTLILLYTKGMKLYQEELMDHYRNPRNFGMLESPDFSSKEHNPSCGDSVTFCGVICEGGIAALAFEGKGCVISLGVASMLSDFCKQKSVAEVIALDKEFIVTMLGIPLGPTRLKCALLPLQALQQGIAAYDSTRTDPSSSGDKRPPLRTNGEKYF